MMRLRFLLVGACVGAGCGAQISAGNDDLASLDASNTPDDTGAPSCTERAVYLNFDGQALHQGPSDAITNHAGWMQAPEGRAPPYRIASADRAATIQAIVDGVRARLDKLSITVVTTRPAQGPYVMIVLGGTSGMVGSKFGAAVNQLDCGDAVPSDVAWIADTVPAPVHVINSAIAAIGFGLGLTATNDASDCMCGWDNQCRADNTVACTLGSAIARDPAARQTCAGVTTQDEAATLRAAFCH
jgi:hypothetical protein